MFVVIFLLVVSFVSASFCGDGVCDSNENNEVYCVNYPFEDRTVREICFLSSSPGTACHLDCRNKYQIPREEIPKVLCGDGICHNSEMGMICKEYSDNPNTPRPVIPGSTCQLACASDCGPVALNSGLDSQGNSIKIPLDIDDDDWINPLMLDLGDCKGQGVLDGKEVKLGICLDNATEKGVQISFRYVIDNDQPLTPDNIQIKTVFIEYYKLYQYNDLSLFGDEEDSYLFPIYNDVIQIEKTTTVFEEISEIISRTFS